METSNNNNAEPTSPTTQTISGLDTRCKLNRTRRTSCSRARSTSRRPSKSDLLKKRKRLGQSTSRSMVRKLLSKKARTNTSRARSSSTGQRMKNNANVTKNTNAISVTNRRRKTKPVKKRNQLMKNLKKRVAVIRKLKLV
ncbi:hypothetical protein AHF37_10106 [Paragonimus kellicotti]|nr:hypothetical protein AHF37_10106 [Paragonimus kellicotti]